jgi:hypothetical protein
VCVGAQARKQGEKKNSSSVNECSFFFVRWSVWTACNGKSHVGEKSYEERISFFSCSWLCDGVRKSVGRLISFKRLERLAEILLKAVQRAMAGYGIQVMQTNVGQTMGFR